MSNRVWRIPAGVAFVDALAAGLLERCGGDPLRLTDMTILLPTRRATRALREAFLRQSGGKPLLLPRLLPIGDLDAEELALTAGADIPAAVAPRRRQMLLARLIRQHRPDWPDSEHFALAKALGQLLDDMTTEQVAVDNLATLVEEELLQEHWQITLNFLQPVFAAWPAILAAEDAIDGAERRNRLMAAQVTAWQQNPPQAPVIVAGSTGAIPATANLIKAVLSLPQGEIILPALPAIEEASSWWDVIDETHPHYELKQLLAALDIPLETVALWPHGVDAAAQRRSLLHTALLPARATAQWQNIPFLNAAGLTRLDAANEQEEATAIALKLRETLDGDGKTAMLVTPDRTLGRRVAEILARWGLQIDDSAGAPLLKTPQATFLRLLLEYAEQQDNIALLALLKHPMMSAGVEPAEARRHVREIERKALRGPKRTPGLAALLTREPPQADWLRAVQTRLHPLEQLLMQPDITISLLLRTLVEVAEALATPERLWRGEAGEVLAGWVADLLESSASYPALQNRNLPELLITLMADTLVRSRFGSHPRLFIFGPMEARLQQADVVILGGLNEQVWPAPPQPDPWLSRPMRRKLGLKSLEARLGQEAHDFYSLAAAEEVVLSRALRQGGQPSVPARWLQRLDTMLHAAQEKDVYTRGHSWLAMTRQLDEPRHITPAGAPAPCPPLAVRPSSMYVTHIEKLMLDPYWVYARYILDLVPEKDLEPEPGPSERGNFIHAVLERFIVEHKDHLPVNAEQILHRLGEQMLNEMGLEAEKARWWPRFARVVAWFLETEHQLRKAGQRPLAVEAKGKLTLPDGFTIKAKADRIDRRADGTLAIIDYKTGAIPSSREQEAGLSLQLPLEAAIARAGGFTDIPEAAVSQLSFWKLSGGRTPGEQFYFRKGADPEQLAPEAIARLHTVISHFREASTPYAAQLLPEHKQQQNDYGHLSRYKEWANVAEDSE